MLVNFLELCFSQFSEVVAISKAMKMACEAYEADATTLSLELETAVPERHTRSTIRQRTMRAGRPE